MPFVSVVNHAGIGSGPLPPCEMGHVSLDSHARLGILVPVLEQLFVFLLLLSSMNVITAFTASSRESSREETAMKVTSADVDTYSLAIDGGVYAFGGILAL